MNDVARSHDMLICHRELFCIQETSTALHVFQIGDINKPSKIQINDVAVSS
jgi:hypothetical protein